MLPGGNAAAAHLHLARTIARRAERLMVALAHTEGEIVSAAALKYINRLSDFLFVAARHANDHGVPMCFGFRARTADDCSASAPPRLFREPCKIDLLRRASVVFGEKTRIDVANRQTEALESAFSRATS